MGYRYSLYCVTKDIVENIRQHPRPESEPDFEDYEKADEYYDEFIKPLQAEEMIYDTFNGLEIVASDEKYSSDLFQDGYEDSDCEYRSIDKEQFRNIIDLTLEHIAKGQKAEKVEMDADTKQCTISPDSFNFHDARYGRKYTNDEILEKMLILQNSEIDMWQVPIREEHDGNFHYFVDMTDNKWKVSSAWQYKCEIYNFIHIYKIFDWEHDVIVLIGQ